MLILDYARAFNPRWLVLENVVHMRPWSRYGELKQTLRDLGYNIAEQVLEAAHFGIAQSRRRLFLVGDRRSEALLVGDKYQNRDHLLPAGSLLDPEGEWRTSPLVSERRAQDTLARARRAFARVGMETPFLIVYYGTDGSGGWQPVTRPLRTVTTIDRFALVTPGRIGHQMRMLQIPELRRAMGFDEAYELPVRNRRDRIRLLGNAVCPPVMAAVVKALTAPSEAV
jgi:DNA (cytosine-5)-methyltransferase 1